MHFLHVHCVQAGPAVITGHPFGLLALGLAGSPVNLAARKHRVLRRESGTVTEGDLAASEESSAVGEVRRQRIPVPVRRTPSGAK